MDGESVNTLKTLNTSCKSVTHFCNSGDMIYIIYTVMWVLIVQINVQIILLT